MKNQDLLRNKTSKHATIPFEHRLLKRFLSLTSILLLFLLTFNCGTSQIDFGDKEDIILMCAYKDGKYGFVDEMGREVIPCKYDKPGFFYNNLVPMQKGKNWSYFNTAGQKVLDLKKEFTFCGNFHSQIAFVSSKPLKNDKIDPEEIAFINQEGELIFRKKNSYELDIDFLRRTKSSEGLILVKRKNSTAFPKGGYAYLNLNGDLQIPFEGLSHLNKVDHFSNGLAKATVKEKIEGENKTNYWHGFINKEGEWVIPPIYASANPFEDGVAIVGEAGPNSSNPSRYYLINTKGERVFPDSIYTFPKRKMGEFISIYKIDSTENGFPRSKTQRSAIAKIDGSMVTPFIFKDLEPGRYPDDPWLFSFPDKQKVYGFIDNKGEVIVNPIYARGFGVFSGGISVVRSLDERKKLLVLNKNGSVLLELNGDIYPQYKNGIMSFQQDSIWKYFTVEGQLYQQEETKDGPHLFGYLMHGPLQRLKLPRAKQND